MKAAVRERMQNLQDIKNQANCTDSLLISLLPGVQRPYSFLVVNTDVQNVNNFNNYLRQYF